MATDPGLVTLSFLFPVPVLIAMPVLILISTGTLSRPRSISICTPPSRFDSNTAHDFNSYQARTNTRIRVREKRLAIGFPFNTTTPHRIPPDKQPNNSGSLSTEYLLTPHYSTDLAPYDFYLFPKIKGKLRGHGVKKPSKRPPVFLTHFQLQAHPRRRAFTILNANLRIVSQPSGVYIPTAGSTATSHGVPRLPLRADDTDTSGVGDNSNGLQEQHLFKITQDPTASNTGMVDTLNAAAVARRIGMRGTRGLSLTTHPRPVCNLSARQLRNRSNRPAPRPARAPNSSGSLSQVRAGPRNALPIVSLT
ncbi:hypothetical protein EVAR_32386_1 [Eumeta japonica]|uniref:Uncharacterized protein n=1 Tax=Eumeta variegata TaxID=151549 RepID=A0A4C1VJY8_EUMVA|nr:hypothetical protein EVAR_32386_1 [Eumeta japonica]